MPATASEEIVRIADRVDVLIRREGHGDPLLFLHSSGGLVRDAPFLALLGESFEVIQPAHPGWPGSEAGLDLVDHPIDVALHYGDLIRELDLSVPLPVVGYSIGGMFGAELAAVEPTLVSRLVLVDAVGLWIEEAPMADFFCTAPEDLAALSFYDPGGEAAKRLWRPSSDPEARTQAEVDRIVSLTAAGKFLWATPDRGLARRLYRIQAPTLVMHGKQDRLSPVETAHAFTAAIQDAREFLVEEAGHAAIREHPETCAAAVLDFLADS